MLHGFQHVVNSLWNICQNIALINIEYAPKMSRHKVRVSELIIAGQIQYLTNLYPQLPSWCLIIHLSTIRFISSSHRHARNFSGPPDIRGFPVQSFSPRPWCKTISSSLKTWLFTFCTDLFSFLAYLHPFWSSILYPLANEWEDMGGFCISVSTAPNSYLGVKGTVGRDTRGSTVWASKTVRNIICGRGVFRCNLHHILLGFSSPTRDPCLAQPMPQQWHPLQAET